MTEHKMDNEEKFIEVFGWDAWDKMTSYVWTADQLKGFWHSPFLDPEEEDDE